MKKQGLDLSSWTKSLRISLRFNLICLVGFLLAWLIFWEAVPSLNRVGATALYNTVSSEPAILIVGAIATLGDIIWIPLVFCLYALRKSSYDWTSSLVLAVATVI